MAQVLLNGTTPNGGDLDANFTELYNKTAWSTSGIGYATGAGAAVTQATNKSTAVTLNKNSGQITMNAASLGPNTTVQFLLNNSLIAQTDCVVLTFNESVSALNYNLWGAVGTGYCRIQLRNISGGALGEAVAINFAVIKAVSA